MFIQPFLKEEKKDDGLEDDGFVERDQQLTFKAGKKAIKGKGKGKGAQKKTGKKARANKKRKSEKGVPGKKKGKHGNAKGKKGTRTKKTTKKFNTLTSSRSSSKVPKEDDPGTHPEVLEPVAPKRRRSKSSAQPPVGEGGGGPAAPKPKAKAKAKAKSAPKAKSTPKAKAKANPKSKAKANKPAEDCEAKPRKKARTKASAADDLLNNPLRSDVLIKGFMDFARSFPEELDQPEKLSQFKTLLRGSLQFDTTLCCYNIYWSRNSCGVKHVDYKTDIAHFSFNGFMASARWKTAIAVRCAYLAASSLYDWPGGLALAEFGEYIFKMFCSYIVDPLSSPDLWVF